MVDAKTGAKLADIKLAGHPESFRLESGGPRIFINVPKANHIAVVDREKCEVISTWQLAEAKSNFPLSLDEPNHRLFAGCRNPPSLLVYNCNTGSLVTSVPISRDTDDLFYDAVRKRIYISCGEGFINIIEQLNPDTYKKLPDLPTTPGTRTSFFSSGLDQFYVAVPRRGSQNAEVRVYGLR